MSSLALVLIGLALTVAWFAERVNSAQTPTEVMDMREPGESFCGCCPDHEACATGYPCSLVRRVNGADQ